MEIKKVRELVKLVEDSGIAELEIIHGDTTIRIQKSQTVDSSPVGFAPPAATLAPGAVPAAVPAATDAVVEAERAKWKEIRSPIVGTFYRAAAPGADVFVNVGDRIQNGQTLCIIEAMKVMNEIEAEFGGIVKEILVENGQPIEAEAILYLVEPS
jgi:acetyl-CoA carboxylase biotin carboxyl carrier protein